MFLTFFILSAFFTFLTFIENSIKKFENHFWNHRHEEIGHTFLLADRTNDLAYAIV